LLRFLSSSSSGSGKDGGSTTTTTGLGRRTGVRLIGWPSSRQSIPDHKTSQSQ